MVRLLVIVAPGALAAGCTAPSGPSGNGIVQVVNMEAIPVTLAWKEAGGDSGSEAVEPCREWAMGFGPGDHVFILTTGSGEHTFKLVAPENGRQTLGLVVADDGSVREAPGGASPTPDCTAITRDGMARMTVLGSPRRASSKGASVATGLHVRDR
jgi:hypothetical protein